MPELLATPGWQSSPRTLAAWKDAFAGQGLGVVTRPDPPGGAWIEVQSLGLRGYAMLEGLDVEAINFEVEPAGLAEAVAAVEAAARALGWEVDPDDDDGEDDEDA